MKLRIEKITGKPSKSAACGIFTKRITLVDSTEGTLVTCILIRGEGADLAQILTGIFEIVQKKLEGADGGILAILKAATGPAKNLGGELDLSFVHAFFYQDACFVVRHGKGIKLSVFDPPKSLELDFESGSGPLAPGQIYVLATEAFLSIFDTSVFEKYAEIDYQELIDGIATDIAGEENQSEIGAGFVQVMGEEEAEAEEVKEVSEVTEEVEEAKEGEVVEERVEEKRFTVPKLPSIPNLFSLISSELGKIRRGDISAIRRNIGAVAIVVVLVLVLSVGFALYKNSQNRKFAEFNQHFSVASAKYAEGLAIVELNRARAREMFIEADREAKLALEIRASDESAKKLAADIGQKLKETEVLESVEFSQVADLGQSAASLSFSGANLGVIGGGKFYQVNLADGTVQDKDLTPGADLGFVFDGRVFYTSGGKIYVLSTGSGGNLEVGNVGSPLDIAVFASNVYVLSENSIAKFVPVEAGYSTPLEYLNNPENFSPKSRFAIDGSIWVTWGTKILKFTRGEKEGFEISGLVGDVGEFSLIYTTPNMDNLYVVDAVNSALLVISKDGVYQKVLQSVEFSRASDLAVDEGEQNVYVAVGKKILSASL